MYTSREQVSCIFFVCGGIDSTYKSTNLYFRSYLWYNIKVVFICIRYMCMNVILFCIVHVCLPVCIIIQHMIPHEGAGIQLPWVICLIICAFNESL